MNSLLDQSDSDENAPKLSKHFSLSAWPLPEVADYFNQLSKDQLHPDALYKRLEFHLGEALTHHDEYPLSLGARLQIFPMIKLDELKEIVDQFDIKVEAIDLVGKLVQKQIGVDRIAECAKLAYLDGLILHLNPEQD